MRKLLRRVFRTCAVLFGLLVVAVIVAVYFARQEPEFYSRLRDKPTEDVAAAEAEVKQLQDDMEQWLRVSLRQQQLRNEDYDPAKDIHTMRITEDQLNAFLASKANAGQVRAPRVFLKADGIEFGAEVTGEKFSSVLSAELDPHLTDDGLLHMDFVRMRLGKLRLPLSLLLRFAPSGSRMGDGNAVLYLKPNPHIVVDLTPSRQGAPTVSAVNFDEGFMEIKFQAPVVKHKR